MFICGTTGYNKLKGQHCYLLKIPQHRKEVCVTYSKPITLFPLKNNMQNTEKGEIKEIDC